VRDGHACDQSCLCSREQFKPIAKDDYDVRRQSFECVGETDRGYSNRFGHAGRSVTGQQSLNAGTDREAIVLDHANRHAKLGRQMHSANGDL
jgi:hypothetical protein